MNTGMMYNILQDFSRKEAFMLYKGRSRRLRPKAHIFDDPLGNPYDGLKVLFGPPYGPYIGPLWPYYPPPKGG